MEMTHGIAIAINDFLDNCCELKENDRVTIVAAVDGLLGGDNLVDETTIVWLYNAVQLRSAYPTVIWVDQPQIRDHWTLPPIFMEALKNCDVFINTTFDFTTEEFKQIHNTAKAFNVRYIRLFATTKELWNTPWAQTPHELVSEIRYQAAVPFGNGGMDFELADPNGTHITGIILPSKHPNFPTYTRWRNESPGYRPFPEWVFPPVNIGNAEGVLVFDRTLSWWSRYLGVSPYFRTPVRVEVKDGKMISITGGEEAKKISEYLSFLSTKFGDKAYNFDEVHSGVHPCAIVPPQSCNNPLIQRIIDHSSPCNIHFHIGAPWPTPDYPYWPHITGDIQNATWRVGNQYVHKNGHLMALDHEKVREIAKKYPDRPGVGFVPKNF